MGEGTPYISSDVPATLELSQRFLIQIQFSWCSHPHPLPPPLLPYSSFFHHSPPFSSFTFPHYFLLSLRPPPFPRFTPGSRLPLLTSLRRRHTLYRSVAT